jgi:hypothetical protein
MCNERLVLNKINNYVIARYITSSAEVKSSGIRIIEARGDDDVSQSSHPCGYYSLLKRCGCTMLTKHHNGSQYSL